MTRATTREVSFEISADDRKLVTEIVKRVEAARPWVGSKKARADQRITLMMDLEACHANGCPMDFAKLLAADEFNFWHDITGIQRRIDRRTGELTAHFRPRCARPTQ
jgi:hypothetical protein